MTTEANNDSFDAAFAEIVATMEATPAAAPAPVAAAVPAPEPVAPVETPPTSDEPPVAPPVETPPPAPVVPPPAPAVTPEPAAPPAPATPPPPAPPVESPQAKAEREAFEASIAPYTPTAEETAAMEQFKKDFPNEAVAIEARLKSVDRDLNARIHKAVQNMLTHVDGRLDPVEATVTETALERHATAIHTAHPDYDVVIAKVPDWIKTLPAYARTGAQAVYDRGTTQEVIELVASYKQAAGVVAPAAPAPVAKPAKPAPAGADDLAPVSSQRAAVLPRGTPDPNDYAGAFAEAVASIR
jgi:hypothetical protein